MRGGILIVGSLLWDDRPERKKWREARLIIEDAVHAKVPIHYGRRSVTRGNTFTMVIAADGRLGNAIIAPCRTEFADIDTIMAEAGELWLAEQPSAAPGNISALWGCVGVRFRDDPALANCARAWADRFREKRASSVYPVRDDGVLDIPWPVATGNGTIYLDLILATATKHEANRPRPEDVADAWVDQVQGHEAYFFENVQHGIRTPDDPLIWRRIQDRRPRWLSGEAYSEAIAILRAEPR